MIKDLDLAGQRFGRLLVVELSHIKNYRNGSTVPIWKCVCDCDSKEILVSVYDLNSGHTESCGCLSKERISKINKKEWEPVDRGDYYDIPLTKGKFAKIDKEDYELIKNSKWSIRLWSSGKECVVANINNVGTRIHRAIMNAPKGIVVDHINGDTLDNRKRNLRLCSSQENEHNSKVNKDNRSGYKGVTYMKKTNKYVARLTINNKVHYLGYFNTAEEAYEAFKKASLELHGEYSVFKGQYKQLMLILGI